MQFFSVNTAVHVVASDILFFSEPIIYIKHNQYLFMLHSVYKLNSESKYSHFTMSLPPSLDSMRFHYGLEGLELPFSHLDETILNERVCINYFFLFKTCKPCDRQFKLYPSLSFLENRLEGLAFCQQSGVLTTVLKITLNHQLFCVKRLII